MPSLKAAALAVALALAVPIGGAQAQTQNELQTMRTFLEIKTDYFAINESTHAVASDSEKASAMAGPEKP